MNKTAPHLTTTTDPNARQVGGTHYADAAIQHWDFAAANYGPGYFRGNATKYVCRWRKKNGLQDLEKARHYVEKLISVDWAALRWGLLPFRMPTILLGDFCDAQDLTEHERGFVACITNGHSPAQFSRALYHLDMLVAEAKAAEAGPGYVNQDGPANAIAWHPPTALPCGDCVYAHNIQMCEECGGPPSYPCHTPR